MVARFFKFDPILWSNHSRWRIGYPKSVFLNPKPRFRLLNPSLIRFSIISVCSFSQITNFDLTENSNILENSFSRNFYILFELTVYYWKTSDKMMMMTDQCDRELQSKPHNWWHEQIWICWSCLCWMKVYYDSFHELFDSHNKILQNVEKKFPNREVLNRLE